MNFNKTALALAVAGITAAPIAAQADPANIYASIRVGVWNVEEPDKSAAGTSQSDTDVRSFSSRFGVSAETDMGNGMTGFGKYEWDVDINADKGDTDFDIRHRYVGVKGDFGKITLGQTYHTFYNYVVGPTDSPWWHSDYAMIEYRGRTDDAISYNYDSGGFSFGVSLYMFREDGIEGEAFVAGGVGADTELGVEAVPSNEEAIDQIEIGASFPIGDLTLGLAVLTTEADSALGTGREIGNGSDEDVIGIALTGISLGDVSLGLGYQDQDEDTGFVVNLQYNNWLLYIEQESQDKASIANTEDHDRLGITLGYTQNLGKDTLIYYEYYTLDEDTGDSDDDRTAIMAVLKYNLL